MVLNTQNQMTHNPVVASVVRTDTENQPEQDAPVKAIDDFTGMTFEDFKQHLLRVNKIALSPRAKARALHAVVRWYVEQNDNQPVVVGYQSSYGLLKFVADDTGIGIWLQLDDGNAVLPESD